MKSFEITVSLKITNTYMIEAESEYDALKEVECLTDSEFNTDSGCILESTTLEVIENETL
jgi:hypothetical protein